MECIRNVQKTLIKKKTPSSNEKSRVGRDFSFEMDEILRTTHPREDAREKSNETFCKFGFFFIVIKDGKKTKERERGGRDGYYFLCLLLAEVVREIVFFLFDVFEFVLVVSSTNVCDVDCHVPSPFFSYSPPSSSSTITSFRTFLFGCCRRFSITGSTFILLVFDERVGVFSFCNVSWVVVVITSSLLSSFASEQDGKGEDGEQTMA